MALYDLAALNDKEFEVLANDILSELYGQHIERFKPGKDGGIDGRFFSHDCGVTIIQAKHYIRSGLEKLKSKLKQEEVKKIEKLDPANYVLATSVALTPENKNQLISILNANGAVNVEVFGADDIIALLDKHPNVLEKHFKLWIASTHILTRILHAEVVGRSSYKIEQMLDESKKFIAVSSFYKALEKLRQSRVLVITGEPGAGKTTLAKNICLYYLAGEYEFVEIINDLSEAEKVYAKNKKQIFYFDDFLGSNYLEAINGNSDSHIMDFIARVEKSDDKIFVLTSRTSILNSGVRISAQFENRNIRKVEYLLNISEMDRLDKAKILYEHVWAGGISQDYIEEIYKDKRYRLIIEHKNYNPRLIEMITDQEKITGVDVLSYWYHVESLLSNPLSLWDHCFNVQSDELIRALVRIVVYSGGVINENFLRTEFQEITTQLSIKKHSVFSCKFTDYIRIATSALLRRDMGATGCEYRVFNPSLSDYVLSEIKGNQKLLSDYVKWMPRIEVLLFVRQLYSQGVIGRAIYLNILQNWIDLYSGDYDFLLNVYKDLDLTLDCNVKTGILKLIKEILDNPQEIKFLNIFIYYLDLIGEDGLVEVERLPDLLRKNTTISEDDIVSIEKFRENFLPDDEFLEEWINESVFDLIDSELDYITDGIDMERHVDAFVEDYSVDEEGVYDDIFDAIKEKVEDLGLDTDRIDISSLVDTVDIDGLAEKYVDNFRESYMSQDDRSPSFSNLSDSNELDPIDDLFDRD
ncbi:MAG: hypothetical protein COB09_05100 [Thalassobium sp.]|nr:MAG: hypothetical protein COB09_05100 [Thalassobium sp.]